MEENKMQPSERITLFIECLKETENKTHCQLVIIDDELMIYDYEEEQFYKLKTEEVEVKQNVHRSNL